mmetsp:Transcript_14805/g.43883  ORF Transcript_14805/g.43883 Transcript_14805/m.43883 type:complete len:238 (+) Transcript_14805:325-1038(+)
MRMLRCMGASATRRADASSTAEGLAAPASVQRSPARVARAHRALATSSRKPSTDAGAAVARAATATSLGRQRRWSSSRTVTTTTPRDVSRHPMARTDAASSRSSSARTAATCSPRGMRRSSRRMAILPASPGRMACRNGACSSATTVEAPAAPPATRLVTAVRSGSGRVPRDMPWPSAKMKSRTTASKKRPRSQSTVASRRALRAVFGRRAVDASGMFVLGLVRCPRSNQCSMAERS